MGLFQLIWGFPGSPGGPGWYQLFFGGELFLLFWAILVALVLFFWGGLFWLFWAILGSPGSPGALVGAKWWGKVVGLDCLILCQIGLILTELCCFSIFYFFRCLKENQEDFPFSRIT